MSYQAKNSHSLQYEISQNKISKCQKMEKLATFLTLLVGGRTGRTRSVDHRSLFELLKRSQFVLTGMACYQGMKANELFVNCRAPLRPSPFSPRLTDNPTPFQVRPSGLGVSVAQGVGLCTATWALGARPALGGVVVIWGGASAVDGSHYYVM